LHKLLDITIYGKHNSESKKTSFGGCGNMALRKCPRCELNYIKDDEKYCNVCRREMKGGSSEPDDSIVMCSECGENPAVKGSDLCAICLREARRQGMQSSTEEESIPDTDELVLGGVALDEMEVPMPSEGEIPESELNEIDKELASDDDIEDEEDEDDIQPEPEKAHSKRK
jgi:hypothetical protein